MQRNEKICEKIVLFTKIISFLLDTVLFIWKKEILDICPFAPDWEDNREKKRWDNKRSPDPDGGPLTDLEDLHRSHQLRNELFHEAWVLHIFVIITFSVFD